MLTTPATSIAVTLNASDVANAKLLRVRYSLKLAGQDSQGPKCYPNGSLLGDSVVLESYLNGGGFGALPASARGNGLLCGAPNDANSTVASGEFTLEVPTGLAFRRFHCDSCTWTTTGTPAVGRTYHSDGFWNDTATALASFTLFGNTADNMLSGSSVIAWLE